jgi:hypothetical protein
VTSSRGSCLRPWDVIGRRRDEDVPVAHELEDAHVELRVREQLRGPVSDQRRVSRNANPREVPLDVEPGREVGLWLDPCGREPPPDRHEVRAADHEDDHAQLGELEHRDRATEKLLGEVARQDVRRGADQRQRPPEHRGVGEREEELRARDVARVGEVGDHRDEHRDDGGVVDDPRERPGRPDGRRQHAGFAPPRQPSQVRAEALDEPGLLDPRREHVHRDDCDRRGTGESRDGLPGRYPGPLTEHHERDDDPDCGDVRGHRFSDEQQECDRDQPEHDERARGDRREGHTARILLWGIYLRDDRPRGADAA